MGDSTPEMAAVEGRNTPTLEEVGLEGHATAERERAQRAERERTQRVERDRAAAAERDAAASPAAEL